MSAPNPQQDSQAIVRDLERQLRTDFADGDRFWSARQLAARYQISSSLAQKVTGLLVGKGLLRTEPRSGTYVIKDPGVAPRRFAFIYGGWNCGAGNALHFEVFHGASEAARRAGCDLLYMPLPDDDPHLDQKLASLTVDGAVLSSRLDYGIADRIRAQGVPVVAYRDPRREMDAVVPDYQGGACQIVSHLVELGHRRIACLQDQGHYYTQWRRGYDQALHQANLPVDEALVWDLEQARRELGRLARGERRAGDQTAAFLPNDSTAFHLIRESGIQVPEQLSVAGFGDRDPEGMMHPALTTVNIQPHRLGTTAIQILLNDHPRLDSRPLIHVLPTKLVVRESTIPVRQAHVHTADAPIR